MKQRLNEQEDESGYFSGMTLAHQTLVIKLIVEVKVVPNLNRA